VPHRAVAQRLRDILEAIARVEAYATGITFEQFCVDRKTIEAAQFNFFVIGEAARHVPEDVVAQHPEGSWREMRALRNIVAHAYFNVSLPVLWETIVSDLPPLVGAIRDLLEQNRIWTGLDAALAPETSH
jgi:uncharacterized protein with HEPN domain